MWKRPSRSRRAGQRPIFDENAELGVALLAVTAFAISGALLLAALL